MAPMRRFTATVSPMLACLAVVACGAPLPSPSAVASVPPTPGPTPRASPTAVPTPVASPAPAPTDRGFEPAELVVRLTTCVELCVPMPGTTILADGRIVWAGPEGRALEARLAPATLADARAELAGHGELGTDGEYQAALRPGAEPFPRGTTVHRFEVGPGDPRIVVSGEPSDYATEPDLWVIPPEMERLAALAGRLQNPIAWLGRDAFDEPPQPYQPARYLVVVELFAGIGPMAEFSVDVDDVASPFGIPLDTIGEPVAGPGGSFDLRCLVTDARTARQLAAAETAAGARRSPETWSSAIAYGWRRGDGFVQVTLTQLLPHEDRPCATLALT